MNCHEISDSRYLAVIKSYSESRDAAGDAAWLVSLGDLLTLLLCFFLAVVSASPLNPAVERQMKEAQNQIDSEPKPPPAAPEAIQEPAVTELPGAGTSFAISSSEAPPAKRRITIAFAAQDFPGAGFALGADAVSKLKREVSERSYAVREALIESCGGGASGGKRAQGWNESVSRALVLQGQLIDSRIAASIIKVRVVGANCDVLNERSGGEVSARVTLILNEG